MTKRGLSITELLVTVGLIAVAIGVLMVGYGNIRTIAQSTAQNKDQTALYQTVAAFNLMGGDMSPIFNSGLNPDEQAAVLTKVLQGSVSASARKQRGEIGKLVDGNMVIVPMTTAGGMALLVPTPEVNPRTLKAVYPTSTTTGFVVVPKDSPLGGQSLAVDWNMSRDSQSRINGVVTKVLNANNLAGARYADAYGSRKASSYVWNEDETYRAGPGTGVTPTNPTGGSPGATRIKYREFYDSALTYANYVNPDANRSKGQGIKLLQFYRENGQDLSVSELDLREITFGGRALTSKGMQLVEGTAMTGGAKVVNLFVYLNEVLPASEWTQDVNSLVVKVKPTAQGRAGAKDRAPLMGDINDQLLITAVKAKLESVGFESTSGTSPLPPEGYVRIFPLPQGEGVALPDGWVGATLEGAPTLENGDFATLFTVNGENTPVMLIQRGKN